MTTLVDVDKWTADDCRWYLRYMDGLPRGAMRLATVETLDLVARVRTRLAALQLAELWPVDPRD